MVLASRGLNTCSPGWEREAKPRVHEALWLVCTRTVSRWLNTFVIPPDHSTGGGIQHSALHPLVVAVHPPPPTPRASLPLGHPSLPRSQVRIPRVRGEGAWIFRCFGFPSLPDLESLGEGGWVVHDHVIGSRVSIGRTWAWPWRNASVRPRERRWAPAEASWDRENGRNGRGRVVGRCLRKGPTQRWECRRWNTRKEPARVASVMARIVCDASNAEVQGGWDPEDTCTRTP